MRLLRESTHNGYPVVHPPEMLEVFPHMGTFAGGCRDVSPAARPRILTLTCSHSNSCQNCVLFSRYSGRLRRLTRAVTGVAGLMHRNHLCMLLEMRAFSRDLPRDYAEGTYNDWMCDDKFERHHVGNDELVTWEELERTYPRYPVPESLALSAADMECYLDMRPYMNRCVHVVNATSPVFRVFRLFRTLGLRHLVVVCACAVVCCGVLWCAVVCCGVLWCAVVCCGVLWCAVVCCGVLWCAVCVDALCTHAQPLSPVLVLCLPRWTTSTTSLVSS
jgi:hypothetical protein